MARLLDGSLLKRLPLMSRPKKIILGLLGLLALILVAGQLVLGQMIMAGPNNVSKLIKMHQHTGYTAVAVSAIYILASLYAILTAPGRVKS
jgi:hypothetical protein